MSHDLWIIQQFVVFNAISISVGLAIAAALRKASVHRIALKIQTNKKIFKFEARLNNNVSQKPDQLSKRKAA